MRQRAMTGGAIEVRQAQKYQAKMVFKAWEGVILPF
jgi:hypothetical protein